jgi:DNA-binding MarR family transcriptional regulator
MSTTTPILISLLTTGRLSEVEVSRALRSLGLSATDYLLLCQLASSPAASAAQLGRTAGLSRQGCRRSLDHLHRFELIESVPSHDDRRATEVHLTREGEFLLAQAARHLSDLESRVANVLGAERDDLLRNLASARVELPEPLRLPWWDWPV